MRFHGLDLNLLVVLDALYVEQHVTRAATRLCLTQSAVSAALGRLREHFDDPMFASVGGRMLPTALMQCLYPRIHQVLDGARCITFANAVFEPQDSQRRFRIMASDYVIAVVMPALKRQLARGAPNLGLQLLTLIPQRDIDPGRLVEEALEQLHCDLVILPRAHRSDRHPEQALFEDGFSVIACRDNQNLAGGLTLERYLASPHVVRETGINSHGSMEAEFLSSQGLERHVAVAVEQFGLIPEFIVGGPCLATLHSRLASHYSQRFALQIFEPPLAFPPTLQVVQWHAYQDRDPALIWLREQLIKSVF